MGDARTGRQHGQVSSIGRQIPQGIRGGEQRAASLGERSGHVAPDCVCVERMLIARRRNGLGMCERWGEVLSSPSVKPHARERLRRQVIGGGKQAVGRQDLGSVGPETLNLIDNEIERMVGDAEARAAAILDRNWSAVEETAAALLEQETLSGVALDAVLSTVQEVSVDELRGVRRAAPPRFTTRDPNPPR